AGRRFEYSLERVRVHLTKNGNALRQVMNRTGAHLTARELQSLVDRIGTQHFVLRDHEPDNIGSTAVRQEPLSGLPAAERATVAGDILHHLEYLGDSGLDRTFVDNPTVEPWQVETLIKHEFAHQVIYALPSSDRGLFMLPDPDDQGDHFIFGTLGFRATLGH